MTSTPASAETAPADEKPRGGGRNLVTATVVGLTLFLGVILTAWWSPLAFAILLYAACMVAVMEWRSQLVSHGRTIAATPLLVGTVLIAAGTWFHGANGLAAGMFGAVLLVLAWRSLSGPRETLRADAYASVMSLAWIPFLGSFLMLTETDPDGWQRVIVLIVAVVAADTGALAAGMTWGRTPLHARVSPNKTWEGLAGGLALAIAASALFSFFLLDGQWWVGAIVGLVAALVSVVGDLAESAIKRSLNIKDMSKLIPGHGGLMDRMDSMFFAAPVVFVAFSLMLGTA